MRTPRADPLEVVKAFRRLRPATDRSTTITPNAQTSTTDVIEQPFPYFEEWCRKRFRSVFPKLRDTRKPWKIEIELPQIERQDENWDEVR
jgi:hypothetical protein